MFHNLIYEKEGAIAIIQLNRPEKKNSLNFELRQELRTALREIDGDSTFFFIDKVMKHILPHLIYF